ncbi:MAG: hypothetical protein P8076_07040 [Gammaproteobacteria bacterium]
MSYKAPQRSQGVYRAGARGWYVRDPDGTAQGPIGDRAQAERLLQLLCTVRAARLQVADLGP